MSDSLPDAPIENARPSAGDGALAALRAVGLVVLVLAALAATAGSVIAVVDGEPTALPMVVAFAGLVAAVVFVFALVVAVPLGALLARWNAVPAAMLLAPVAGFLFPLALFQNAEFAGMCGAISILVGAVYATDPRFRSTP